MEQQQRGLAGAGAPDVPHHRAVSSGASWTHRNPDGVGSGGDAFDMLESGTAVRHARDGGIIETHFFNAPNRRSTKPGAFLRSIQRSTVTRSLSGSIQTMWLPQPSAK